MKEILPNNKKYINSKIILATFIPVVILLAVFILSIVILIILITNRNCTISNTQKVKKIELEKRAYQMQVCQMVLEEWDKILPALKGYEKLSEKLKELNIISQEQSEILKCLEDISEFSFNKRIVSIPKENLKHNIENELNTIAKEIAEEAVKSELTNLQLKIKNSIPKILLCLKNINNPQEWRNFLEYVKLNVIQNLTKEKNPLSIEMERSNIPKISKDIQNQVWNILILEMPEEAKKAIEKWQANFEEVEKRMKHYNIEINPEDAEKSLSELKDFVKKSFINHYQKPFKEGRDPGKATLENLTWSQYTESTNDTMPFLSTILIAIFSHLAQLEPKLTIEVILPVN